MHGNAQAHLAVAIGSAGFQPGLGEAARLDELILFFEEEFARQPLAWRQIQPAQQFVPGVVVYLADFDFANRARRAFVLNFDHEIEERGTGIWN